MKADKAIPTGDLSKLSDEQLTPKEVASLTKLAKSNFTKFAIAFQEMSADVRIKLIEQMPEFRALAKEALDKLTEAFNKSIESNDSSEAQVFESYKTLIDSLTKMLDQNDLSLEEQLIITEKINEAAREAASIDKSNKQFKLQMFGKYATTVVVIAGAVVAAVAGGKMMIDSKD